MRLAPIEKGCRAALTTLLAVVVLAVLAPLGSATASPPAGFDNLPRSYLGPAHGSTSPIGPTRNVNQSKLWFHDSAWWALMLEPPGTGMRIFELLPDHTWRPTATVVQLNPASGADVLAVDDTLYVVSRGIDSAARFVRLTYDRTQHEYLMRIEPVVVTDSGNATPPSVTRDTAGRLWLVFATTAQVIAVSSGDDGATWSRPFAIAAMNGPATRPPTATAVAFDESVGVMWSDKIDETFRFAVHRDGTPEAEWQIETALEVPGLADDHISLKVLDRHPADAVVAAVKTSEGNQGEPADAPLILVLSRAPDGTWSSVPAATVGDGLNAVLLQLDATNAMVHVFATGGGSVFTKSAPLDALVFPPGRGRPFVTGEGRLAQPTGSTHPVDARTGLVILASGMLDQHYYHAEARIPGTPPPEPELDTEPPRAPSDLVIRHNGGVVTLYWSASNDGERWAPAADSSPVRGYRILRDGVVIGTAARTSFADIRPPGAYSYSVQAIDFGDNASPPAVATILIEEERSGPMAPAGWTLLGAGGALATTLAAFWWTRVRRRS